MIKTGRLKLYLLPVFILFILFVMTAGEAFAVWYSFNWGFRQKITIDSSMVPGDLSNFPVLVSVTNTNLIASPGGNVGKLNGGDILFTNSNGTIKLDHEIESYNNATGALVAWVEVPAVWSTADTVFYMYYGNAGVADQWDVNGTWDEGGANNYINVHHLQENSGTLFDSTSFGADAATFGGASQGVSGIIDGAVDFAGVNESMTISNIPLGNNTSHTISVWVKPDGIQSGNPQNIYHTVYSNIAGHTGFRITGTNNSFQFTIRSLQDNPPGSGNTFNGLPSIGRLTEDVWSYVTLIYETGTDLMSIYLNGNLDNSKVSFGGLDPGFFDGSVNLTNIGGRPGPNDRWFNGAIDELRISDIVRSPDWIEASFNNQNNPSLFLGFGAQEIFVPAPTMTEWGMIIFMVFAGLVSVYYLRRKGIV